MHPQDFSCCPCVACFVGIRLKPVAHSKIKLKQNTETAWNSFKLVSASLAGIFSACKYEAERSLKLFQAVSVFCFSFILECATGLSLNSFGENWKRIYSVDMTELYCIEVFCVIALYRSTFAPLLCLSLTSCFFSLCSRSLWSTLNHECCRGPDKGCSRATFTRWGGEIWRQFWQCHRRTRRWWCIHGGISPRSSRWPRWECARTTVSQAARSAEELEYRLEYCNTAQTTVI